MGKKLEFEVDGTAYTLEFNRATVQRMEHQGFLVQEVGDKPLTYLPQLFHGAFRMHHPALTRAQADAILDRLGNKQELIATLANMYAEPIESLMEEPKKGKVAWKVI